MKVLAILVAVLMVSTAAAETFNVWVLCQPDSFVYVREFPKKESRHAGFAQIGDKLTTDGQKRNGYLHVDGFEGGGWIYAGFVTESPVTVEQTESEIVSNGRVACRRYINGTRRRWLKNGQNLTVYARSAEWSVTSQGFIQTRFLGAKTTD